MGWIALRMLTGDKVKYYGLIFGIAFSTLLIAQQSTLFVNLMLRASAAIWDVTDADLWVMDSRAEFIDGTKPLPSTDLYRVRGVPGVAWAVPNLRQGATVRTAGGELEQVTVVGLDDSTLIGLPRRILRGSPGDLSAPDSLFIDDVGSRKLFPNADPVGQEIELNDRRAVIRGVVDANPSFTSGVLLYTQYSNALNYVPGTRNRMTFVLARAAQGQDAAATARRIEAATGLRARTQREFASDSIYYVAANTGIPINFGLTVLLGFIVGVAIVGLTFSLFIRDNIKQFGALKAIGVTNSKIRGMVALQAGWIGFIGYGIGIGLATAFIVVGGNNSDTFKGFYVPWQVLVGVGIAVLLMVFGTGFLALVKVLRTEPAEVFR
ncbi:MAG TPA: ABC transporter permease [Allosphingosinicella sp.]